jgi:hypothetical protein
MRRKTTDLQERALLFLHDFQPRKTGEIREALGKPRGWDTVGFIRRIQSKLINSPNRLHCLPTRGIEKTWQMQPRRPRKQEVIRIDAAQDEYPCWILGIKEQ